MAARSVNIGYGNVVMIDRIIAVVSEKSAPVKRIIQDARDNGMLVDATYGRRMRSVIIMDSHHVVLSPVHPETISGRIEGKSVADCAEENE